MDILRLRLTRQQVRQRVFHRSEEKGRRRLRPPCAWLGSDIHLNFLPRRKLIAFVEEVAAARPDAILLGGDVAEAESVASTLEMLSRTWATPIYFVLGNHDFYHGSIAGVRAEVASLCQRVANLTWLSASRPVWLTERTALIGHDGWGDGGFGSASSSPIQINDFTLIKELAAAPRGQQRLTLLRRLGEEAANHLRFGLSSAMGASEKVIALTHVPPFREATWHEGRISDNNWLPWFACRAVGEMLREAMERHPEKEMLALCGHTHGAGECQILPNLRVLTGGAEYGKPRVQRMIEVA